jgi:hypothetical protein
MDAVQIVKDIQNDDKARNGLVGYIIGATIEAEDDKKKYVRVALLNNLSGDLSDLMKILKLIAKSIAGDVFWQNEYKNKDCVDLLMKYLIEYMTGGIIAARAEADNGGAENDLE